MYDNSDVAIIIPARIGSTRLKNKALKTIGDKTIIAHVLHNIMYGNLNNVYVATDSEKIANHVRQVGGNAIITSKDCLTGSDRVYEAFQKIFSDNNKIQYIINVQGDMPFVDYRLIIDIMETLKNKHFDIVTPVVKVNKSEVDNNSSVKVVMNTNYQALYFSRSIIPHGAKNFLYHIGIYGYTSRALKKFVSLKKTEYEVVENLEQLRALQSGMSIGIVMSNALPISIDTYKDLQQARIYYHTKKLPND